MHCFYIQNMNWRFKGNLALHCVVYNTTLIAFHSPGDVDAEEPFAFRGSGDMKGLRRPGGRCSQLTDVGSLAPRLLVSANQFLSPMDRGFLPSPARGRTDDDWEVWADCLRLGPAQFLSLQRAETPHYTETHKCLVFSDWKKKINRPW